MAPFWYICQLNDTISRGVKCIFKYSRRIPCTGDNHQVQSVASRKCCARFNLTVVLKISPSKYTPTMVISDVLELK